MALTFPISASLGQTYQSGSSNTYEWTGTYWKIKNITSQNFVTRNEYNHLSSSAVIFDINNNINLKGAGVIKNKSDNKTVNIVGNNFVQLQWTTDAGLAEADPNSTTQPTNWAYIDSDGFHIETNVNQSGSNYWDFNNNGDFNVGGNQIISGSIIPVTGEGTYTSSFSLGSKTNAWKDLYISHGSIIFVDAQTQETSSFSIDNNAGQNTVKYTAAVTASAYLGDGAGLTNISANTNWNKDKLYIVRDSEQLTFSGDYILENSVLSVESSNTEIEYSPNKYFKKEGSIFIGGNLLLKDSLIQNDGKISVGGEVILIGDSQIIGTGTII